MSNGANFASVFKKSTWLFRPVVKVGSNTKQSAAIYPWVVSGNTQRERTSCVVADKPNTAWRSFGDHMADCGS
jgi:hypothetical protein